MSAKKPLVMYQGIIKQLQSGDALGVATMVNVSKNIANNNEVIPAFTKVFVDTSSGSFTLKLPSTASRGDVICFIDAHNNFESANLTIDPNGLNIQGDASVFNLDVPGAVVTLHYDEASTGWRIDIGGTNLNLLDDSTTFNIAASTAAEGSRVGKLVYLASVDTVALAKANNDATMPVVGIIILDGDTTCNVRSRDGIVVEAKADSNATINANDVVFASDIEQGKITNNPPTTTGVVQKIGNAKKDPVSGSVEIIFDTETPIYL